MPQRLGSLYTLDALVGRGAMGEVWRGRSDAGGTFAFKLLRPDLAADDALVTRFLRERAILVRLNSPYAVRVHDLVAEAGRLAIVMDYVDGPDLRRELRGRGTLPPAEAVSRALEILTAVRAAHEIGVVHRDLKPENVLLAAGRSDAPPSDAPCPGADETRVLGRRALVTDFGIARLLDGSTSLTSVSGVLGTPHYMAPETIDRGEATPSADLYAVGIILYELLCGVSPFADRPPIAALRAHLDLTPGRPNGLPDGLWSALARLLEKDPRRRPGGAGDAVDLLLDVAEGLEHLSPMPALTQPPSAVPVVGRAASSQTGPTKMGTRRLENEPPSTASDPSAPSAPPPSPHPSWPPAPTPQPSRPPMASPTPAGPFAYPQHRPAASWPPQGGGYPAAPNHPWGAPPAPRRRRRRRWVTEPPIIVLAMIGAIVMLLFGLGLVLSLVESGDDASDRDPAAAIEAANDPNAEVTVHLAESRQLQVVGRVEVGQVTVSGRPIPRSIIMRANYYYRPLDVGRVEFDLGRHFTRFQATAGLADDATSSAAYLVEVHGDGRQLAEHRMSLGQSVDLDIDVTGILRLRLSTTRVAEDTESSAHFDVFHTATVFGDARVTGRQADIPPSPEQSSRT